MPGDDLLAGAASTTRAISVAAPPEQVWPWLVQLGYGRAGWYSYDWIDNDGHRSANRIIPELQELGSGPIPMLPGIGRSGRSSPTGPWSPATTTAAPGAWPCTRPARLPTGQPLAVNWPLTPATAFWILLSDPGAFIMERRMLKGVRDLAERARTAGPNLTATTSLHAH